MKQSNYHKKSCSLKQTQINGILILTYKYLTIPRDLVRTPRFCNQEFVTVRLQIIWFKQDCDESCRNKFQIAKSWCEYQVVQACLKPGSHFQECGLRSSGTFCPSNYPSSIANMFTEHRWYGRSVRMICTTWQQIFLNEICLSEAQIAISDWNRRVIRKSWSSKLAYWYLFINATRRSFWSNII